MCLLYEWTRALNVLVEIKAFGKRFLLPTQTEDTRREGHFLIKFFQACYSFRVHKALLEWKQSLASGDTCLTLGPFILSELISK